MNYDSAFIKENAKRMSQMSDDDLQRAARNMPNMPGMPGMPPGGLDAKTLRDYSNMMSGMSEEQIKSMADMARNMGYNPFAGGMPNMGAMPNLNTGYQNSQSGSSIPKQKIAKEDDPFSKPEDQKKFESVNEIKNKANDLFKNNELSKASEKYYEVINAVRTTKCLKDTPQGNKLEINCRLNLALCKIKQEDYDVAIDQCERVLLQENNNVKALYRISVALDKQNHQLEAWSYIKRAYNITPADKAISELYNTLQKVKDDHQKKKQKSNEEEEKEDSGKQDNEDLSDEGMRIEYFNL